MVVRLLRDLNERDWQQELQQLDPRITVSDVSGFLEPGTLFFKVGEFPFRFLSTFRKILIRHCGAVLVQHFPSKTSGQFIMTLPAPQQRAFLEQLNRSSDPVLQEVGATCARILDNLQRDRWQFQAQGKSIDIDRPIIMGVLNVTPDSFSDGGKFLNPEAAYRRAMEMREQGAEWIDIGGESTRPGSEPVSLEEEWQRIVPVLRRLSKQKDIILSVDTYKSEIARRALEHGAHVVNDISGLTFDPQMRAVVATFNVPVILMHIKGTPRDMQKNPTYTHLMEEVYGFLKQQVEYAHSGGVAQVVVDPGIGFGKRWEDNYEILRRLAEFRGLGCPILIGPSRKSFIGRLLDLPPEQRVTGTMAAVAAAYQRGARIFRVHDVEETRQTLQILEAISRFKAM